MRHWPAPRWSRSTRRARAPRAASIKHQATVCDNEVFQVAEGVCIAARDIEFSSPNAAASRVAGSPQNGKGCWRWCFPGGKVLGDLDDAGMWSGEKTDPFGLS